MNSGRHIGRTILTVVLLLMALAWSFASLIGRADSWEEVRMGKIVDWVFLGPLWASVVYLTASDILRSQPKGRAIAVGVALVIWVVVASASNWWEDAKVHARLDGARDRHRRREQQLSNHAVEPTLAPEGARGSP